MMPSVKMCDLRSRILPGLQANLNLFIIREKNMNQAHSRGPNKDTSLCT